MKKLRQSKKRGSVLAMMLLALVLLFVMGTSLLRLGLYSRTFSARTASEIAARSAADAGLTKALFEMNEKLKVKPWNDSNLPQATNETLSNCDAVFSYTITADSNSVYSIESTGNSGPSQREVNSSLQLRGLFEYAVLVVETINMQNNNLIDGYNSATGEINLKTQIGTMSTAPGSITFGNGTINGDVFVGVDGDAATVIQCDGTITGQTYALSEEYVLPTITPPALPDNGTIDVPGTTVLSPADNGRYASITSFGGVLEIDGGDVVLHITGNINMDSGSEILIKDGSSLTVYVDGNVTFVNGAGINNQNGACDSLKVYSTGTGNQVFELKNNSDMFGVVYAPNADVSIMNNANLYGSITAKNFTMKNNGAFHHDAALRNVSVNDEGVRFVVKRWYEE